MRFSKITLDAPLVVKMTLIIPDIHYTFTSPLPPLLIILSNSLKASQPLKTVAKYEFQIKNQNIT